MNRQPPLAARAAPPGSQAVRRICVFVQLHGPGLGDMVQRNILLSLLRRVYPEATVTLVVGKRLADQHADLLNGHTYATDQLLCPDPFDTSDAHWQDFLGELANRDFDLCVVDPGSHALDASHAAAAGIGVRVGFQRGRPSDRYLTHPVRLPPPLFGFPDLYEYASAIARALGVTEPLHSSEVMPALPTWPEEIPELAAAGPRIAVHPTGAPHWNRRWPLASFGELCARLAVSLGATLYLLGGSDEGRELNMLRDAVLAQCPGARVHLETGGTLNRTASLLRGVDLLIGNDSGLVHVSASVGVPTVTILGPTGAQLLWARIYPRHTGVSLYYPCQGIIHDVDHTAERVCEHSCAVRYQGPDGSYPRCLSDLGVEQVWAAVTAELRACQQYKSGSAHGQR